MKRTRNYYLNLKLVFLVFFHTQIYSIRQVEYFFQPQLLYCLVIRTVIGVWNVQHCICYFWSEIWIEHHINLFPLHDVWYKIYYVLYDNGATILTFWLFNWILQINIIRSISFALWIFDSTFLLKLFVWTKYAIHKVYRKTATSLWTVCSFGASFSNAII